MKSTMFTRLGKLSISAIILVACNDSGRAKITVPEPVVVEEIEKIDTGAEVDENEALFNRRKADLAKLSEALEQYKKTTGSYPKTGDSNWVSVLHSPAAAKTAWLPSLVPNYIDETPIDPVSGYEQDSPQYLYKSNGNGYKLIVHKSGDCDKLSGADPAKPDPKRSNEKSCWAWGYFTQDFSTL